MLWDNEVRPFALLTLDFWGVLFLRHLGNPL